MVKPASVLDDIVVSIASWEYPVDFMVVESKDPYKGNPIILGRPWLAEESRFLKITPPVTVLKVVCFTNPFLKIKRKGICILSITKWLMI